MPKLTIPAYLPELTFGEEKELLRLMSKFGNARRRAYSMFQKDVSKSDIEKRLQRETGLNVRYVKDALHSVKDLPRGVTFGGKRNQDLRMRDKISKEEYERRKNSILISRGERSKKGNLNLRIIDDDGLKLRINIGNRKWTYPKLYIPEKYLEKYEYLLDGPRPYQVTIKRRDNVDSFDVKITVEVDSKIKEVNRLMALDLNSGHVDYAVLGEGLRLIQVGRFDCYALLHTSSNERENLLHKLANRIAKIAHHFNAKVIVGKLNTGKFVSWNSRANRRVKQMPQYKLRQILKYKIPLKGIPVEERSEAYTTKIGVRLAPLIGLDVHKAAAIIFALKIIDYEKFNELRSSIEDGNLPRDVRADEGDGSPSARPSVGSGLTARGQSDLVVDEVLQDGGYPATPGSWGLSQLAEGLKPNLAQKNNKH